MEKKKHYSSVFNNEQKLLKALLEIHNNGNLKIDIDPMYNQGMFYKDGLIPQPRNAFDISPENIKGSKRIEGYDDAFLIHPRPTMVFKADATKLSQQWDQDWIKENKGIANSIILDPPFMFRKMNKSELGANIARYTVMESYEEMEKLYKGIIREANIVLKKNGLLIFKCQDFTNSKTTMTHVLVHKWLEEAGFYVKDLAILDKKWKISNPNTRQRHFRKTHTYFWVAIKKTSRRNDDK